jgi:hypothetical protein
VQSDETPQRFQRAERETADQEAVCTRQRARDREHRDERAMPFLERVRQSHQRDTRGVEKGQSVPVSSLELPP